ncbi:MAG: hypothetical protein KIH64_014130 [Mycobacterium sp.]|nr:hypothetical protein [Mycobacterium sp.]
MPKYLALFKSGGSGMTEPSAGEHKAWMDWREAVGDAIVDFGAPTTAVPGGGGGDVGGYSIVQADSLEALDAVFENNPHRHRGGIIELHEIVDMDG